MKKSQISVEFVFAVGVVLFVFIGLLLFNFDRKADLRETEKYLEEQNLCLEIASLMTATYVSGDGTTFDLYLDYNATISSDSRGIAIEGGRGYCIMPFDSYSDEDLEQGNTYSFTNNNNHIEIENA